MQSSSRTKRHTLLALFALALGGFAIGASEFSGMGLLPEITRSLMPAAFTASPPEALARTGWIISAYALGVVVGAPTIAAATARLPQKWVLTGLLAVFTLGSAASAASSSLSFLIGARFLTGLPHGAYFGLAALVARKILGPNRRGLGSAIVIGGLTIANVLGVPVVTWLGQRVGWQSAYIAIAAIFATTFICVATLVPLTPGDSQATFSNELRVFGHAQVWWALAMGSIGFGGLFTVYSYIAPLAQNVTRMPSAWVPVVLATIGVGMTIGNFLGGWAADRSVRRTTYAAFGLLTLGLLSLITTATSTAGLLASCAIIGVGASALGPTIQTRLMDVARDGQTLAAALNHSAFNVANGLGAALGGFVIAHGFGYLAPAWVGLCLTAGGLSVACITYGIDRLRRRAGVVLPYGTGWIAAIRD